MLLRRVSVYVGRLNYHMGLPLGPYLRVLDLVPAQEALLIKSNHDMYSDYSNNMSDCIRTQGETPVSAIPCVYCSINDV